jgi:hypothetical protein
MSIDRKAIPTVVNRFGSTTLFEDISADATEIQVADGSGLAFDEEGGCIQIEEEILIFGYRIGGRLFEVRRGQDGTTARSYSRGTVVRSQIVALNFNSLKNAVFQLEDDSKTALKRELITLTQEMIENKFLELQSTPSSEASVQVIPQGGPAQFPGEDFSVIQNIITWNLLGLDGFLDIGDKLLIYYRN